MLKFFFFPLLTSVLLFTQVDPMSPQGVYACLYFVGGVVIAIDQPLPCLVHRVHATFVGGELRLEGVVLLQPVGEAHQVKGHCCIDRDTAIEMEWVNVTK